jgi:hypothetical protein
MRGWINGQSDQHLLVWLFLLLWGRSAYCLQKSIKRAVGGLIDHGPFYIEVCRSGEVMNISVGQGHETKKDMSMLFP